MDERQQQELDEERMQEALDVLRRVMWHQASTADILYLAHELGVTKQFEREIAQRKAA